MAQRTRLILNALALVGITSACSEGVTAARDPRSVSVNASASRSESSGTLEGTGAAHGRPGSPYYCSASRRVRGGEYLYEYGVIQLRIPPAGYASDGKVTIYRVVSFGGDGNVAGQAHCQIPDTDAARSYVNRLFHVRPIASRRQDAHDGLTTQGDPVPVDGFTGYACRYGGTYPHCNYEPALTQQEKQVECSALDPYCGSGGSGDEGDSGEEWGGGGDDSEPPPPEDYRDPCRRDAQGYCVPEDPTEAEWQQLLVGIEGIQENNEHCTGAKRYLQRLASTGRGANLKVWTGYDKVAGKQFYGANRFFPGTNERYIVLDRDWGLKELPLVVHEGLHAYFSLLASNSGVEESSEVYAVRWQETCGYTFSAQWHAAGR